MAKIKGICRNEECDHCDEIMEAEKSNFVCEYCQKPLFPISAKETGGGGDGPNWKLIGIIAAAVAVIGGGLFFAFSGGKKSQPKPKDPVVVVDGDSIRRAQEEAEKAEKEEQRRQDSLRAQAVKDSLEKIKKTGDPIPQTPPKTINLGYGIYEGPVSGGKANGIGGEIRFTRSYTIDLKNGDGETVEVSAGDKMINVKMENNRIIKGQLKRKDGSQRLIIVGV